jgi:hypothetical protein
MGLDDLTMMANTPVSPADVEKARDADLSSRRSGEAAQAEIDKAAAGETMPPPKEECEDCEDTRAERIARRGQDPPDPAKV